jgi:glycosyltransferase involved in cell wall biosynthesis
MSADGPVSESSRVGAPVRNAFPRSLAIRSCFAHHAASSGYRQILRFTRPLAEIGIDERSAHPAPWPMRSYLWLYEFQAAVLARRLNVDLIHVLYAENYFRFLGTLCPRTPIVLTFHQPPDLLRVELERGCGAGRAAALTHRMTAGRFRRVAAAIVTSESQRECVERFIDPARVHCIPLGVDAGELLKVGGDIGRGDSQPTILTVGNWKRDWLSYFEVVRFCAEHRPKWRFVLINRRLPEVWVQVARDQPNLSYLPGVSDSDLYLHYAAACVQYLPLEGAAGNNAVNESLALGCPVVSNADLGFGDAESGIVVQVRGTAADTCAALERFVLGSAASRRSIADRARAAVLSRDWSQIGERTLEVYRSVL